jgi:hypothetical protein
MIKRIATSLFIALMMMVLVNLLVMFLDYFNMISIVTFEEVIYEFDLLKQVEGLAFAFFAIFIPYKYLTKEEYERKPINEY